MSLLRFSHQLPILQQLLASSCRPVVECCLQHLSTQAETAVQSSTSPLTVSPSQTADVTPSSTNQQSTASTTVTPEPTDSEWTEVVHTSGQIYYWNQKTGETTNLGEPKPQSSSSGNGFAGGSGIAAEERLPDKTGQYAMYGIILGAFFGWFSQFV